MNRHHATGDTGGSALEGIGADQRRGAFYVSEVTGGEIHCGTTRSAQTSEWLLEGADGAAYFTDSNDPQVFRVADDGGGWTASLWADARGSVERLPGFDLGGIVLTADRSALVVAQGTTGQPWRFDSADGLVRQGATLTVVRNYSRMLATLRLSADGRTATVSLQQATDPSRVLTTAATLDGRILFVDSKCDEPVANPPYEVVTDRMVR